MKPSETTTTSTTTTTTTTTTTSTTTITWSRRQAREGIETRRQHPRPTDRETGEERRGEDTSRTEQRDPGITDEPVVRNTCLREPRPPCLRRLSARPSIRGQPRRRRCITIGDSPSSSFSPFISRPSVRPSRSSPPSFHDTLVAAPPRFAHSLEGNEQIKAAPAGASIRRPCSLISECGP